MLISEYFGQISQLFASYSSAGFLLSSNELIVRRLRSSKEVMPAT
ncbi:hypothetical protein HKBW3S42_00155 [Candidatus Hakubella thermalkaliphila]|uniref:Uncharacterized protein n=1 Tax=Candidatus Hakubella thermalkaliphila TaxID=2754717 RepID=A0A6V8PGN3_9ACTN|nr:hypothetical protein HKBW3S42_00155 [Candidatus Hakubella thermalkaliphila]